MNALLPFLNKRVPETSLVLSTRGDHSKKIGIHKPGSGLPLHTESACALDFSTSHHTPNLPGLFNPQTYEE